MLGCRLKERTLSVHDLKTERVARGFQHARSPPEQDHIVTFHRVARDAPVVERLAALLRARQRAVQERYLIQFLPHGTDLRVKVMSVLEILQDVWWCVTS